MTELRFNVITREWVIIDTGKKKKPEDMPRSSDKKMTPEFLQSCPFCPGNETRTPDEVYSVHDERGWKIRVVPNKFGNLSREGERKSLDHGLKRRVAGVGIHNVIIETPNHSHTTAIIPVGQLHEVIQTYKNLFLDINHDPKVEHIILFKNHGAASGTSIVHPHSQIVGLPITPPQISTRIQEYAKFFHDTGECLMCNMIHDELNDGLRILFETEHFVSFIPYAALSAFHVWLFPKRHTGSFSDIGPDETLDLAFTLKSTMAMLYYGLGNPDFNYIIRSVNPEHATEFTHWYLSVIPRVGMPSGFELGSGMYLNPLLPEVSSEFLRSIRIPDF